MVYNMAEHTIPITLNVVGTGATAQEAQTNAQQKILTVVRAVCANNGYGEDVTSLTPEANQFARRWLMDMLRNEVWRWQHNEASRAVVPEAVDMR